MLAAVIVTFNRKELLGENIRMLLKQTRPFDKIFVVDNCSTDGTPEYLKDQGWMDDPRFVYVKTHANIGGAGGFYTGTKAAYEAGADYIVLMDDDGRAADEHTFENLLREAFFHGGFIEYVATENLRNIQNVIHIKLSFQVKESIILETEIL